MTEYQVSCRHCEVDRVIVVDDGDQPPPRKCPNCAHGRRVALLPDVVDESTIALVRPAPLMAESEPQLIVEPEIAVTVVVDPLERLHLRRQVPPGVAKHLGRPARHDDIGPPAPTVAPPVEVPAEPAVHGPPPGVNPPGRSADSQGVKGRPRGG